MDAQVVSMTSRQLTQDEIDAHNRYRFVSKVLDWITTKHIDQGKDADGVHHSLTIGGKTARFLVIKNHYNLVVIKEVHTGEWEFSVADKHFYSYHMNDLVRFLEEMFDTGARIQALKGEIEF